MLRICIIIKTCAAIDIKNLHWYHDSKFHIDILVYRYISPIPTVGCICLFSGNQIFMDFVSFLSTIIYEVLYT